MLIKGLYHIELHLLGMILSITLLLILIPLQLQGVESLYLYIYKV